jgi:hypothetical protein
MWFMGEAYVAVVLVVVVLVVICTSAASHRSRSPDLRPANVSIGIYMSYMHALHSLN